MREAIRSGVHGGLAAWQVLVIATVLASPTTMPALFVVVAHAFLAALAVAGRVRGWSTEILLIGVYAVQVLDVLATEDLASAYGYVVLWAAILQTGTPCLSLPGRRAALISVGAAAVAAVLFGTIGPERESGAGILVAVLGLVLAVGGRGFRAELLRRALRVDTDLSVANEAERMARWHAARERSADVAARALHDGVLNSLTVLARGAPPGNGAVVRAQCADDARRARALVAGSAPPPMTIGQVVEALPLPVRRRGLDDVEVAAIVTSLAPGTLDDVVAAVGELLRNAARHSGAAEVELDIHLVDDAIRVVVSDGGRGFDGTAVPGRGLAESVLRRCARVGATVDLVTAPGAGTTVTVAVRRTVDSAASAATHGAGVRAWQQIRLRSALTWAALVGVSLAVQDLVVRLFGLPSTSLVTVLVLAGVVLGWWTCRHGRAMPAWCSILMMVPLGVVPIVGAQAVSADSSALLGLSAISLTAVLALLAVAPRTRTPFVAGVTVMVAASAGASLVMLLRGEPGYGLVLVLLVPQLGQLAGLVDFFARLDVLARQAAAAAAIVEEAREHLAGAEADAEIRAGLRRSSLDRTIELLEDIAVGRRDPRDPATMDRCAMEEHHLRQMLAIGSASSRDGWRCAALEHARRCGVVLDLTSDTAVLPTTVRRGLIELLRRLVDEVPPASVVGVSTWSGDGSWRVAVTAPEGVTHGLQDPSEQRWAGVAADLTRAQERDVLELAGPAQAVDASTARTTRRSRRWSLARSNGPEQVISASVAPVADASA